MPNHTDIQKSESLAGGSPFYRVNRQRFQSNFDDLTAAFSSRYMPLILAYSYKTNYLPYLCQIITQKGGWAEVVSRMEYDLALKVGQDPKRIIFNGPVKTADDIALALDNDTLVNADSKSELDLILDYADKHPGRAIPIGLRINIGLSDEAGRSHIQNSLKVGRFGLDPGDFGKKCKMQKGECKINESPVAMPDTKWEINSSFDIQHSTLQTDNLKIVSLHGHTSTTDRSAWCFEVITRTLCDIAEKHFPGTVEMINIGGGFFGKMHPGMPFQNVPAFADYAQSICNVLQQSAWVQQKKPTLVIEPGVAMAADCVSFVTKVMSVKSIQDRLFVTVDGSAFNTKPTFHSLNMPYQVITQKPDRPVQTYSIVGSTCMEKDILLKDISSPLPEPGDYICIDNVGAYTLVMTPPFIHPAPAIVADDGQGQYKLIRRKQTLNDIFANYSFQQ
jgi:diaminopimelate decarboxylase